MNREERGPWYLLTALLIGAALGLLFAWVLTPVQYVDNLPDSLRDDYKDQYRALIAAAYAANGNLPRASERLRQLKDEDMVTAILEQAQRAQAEGRPPIEANHLEMLAVALVQNPQTVPVLQAGTPAGSPEPLRQTQAWTETPAGAQTTPAPVSLVGQESPAPQLPSTATPQPPASATPTSSPSATPTSPPGLPGITPLPSRSPTPTQGAPFVLKQEAVLVCNPSRTAPLIIVETLDAAEGPVPGVQVQVYWQGGEDRFFTGLKPELGLGYGDFEMTPGITYMVQIAGGGQPISGLSANECETAGRERYYGSWSLVFIQP